MPEDPAATAAATPEPTKAPEPTPTPEPAKAPAKDDAPLGEKGEKALEAMKQRARDAEAKVKELSPLAEKARELEEAQQSEVEKAQTKAQKAQQEAAEAKTQLLRYEVAQEKEIPAKLVPLLTGTTKEDLEAQADLILENVKAGDTPDFNGGAREPAPEPMTPEQAHNATAMKLLGLTPNT